MLRWSCLSIWSTSNRRVKPEFSHCAWKSMQLPQHSIIRDLKAILRWILSQETGLFSCDALLAWIRNDPVFTSWNYFLAQTSLDPYGHLFNQDMSDVGITRKSGAMVYCREFELTIKFSEDHKRMDIFWQIESIGVTSSDNWFLERTDVLLIILWGIELVDQTGFFDLRNRPFGWDIIFGDRGRIASVFVWMLMINQFVV